MHVYRGSAAGYLHNSKKFINFWKLCYAPWATKTEKTQEGTLHTENQDKKFSPGISELEDREVIF